MHVYIYMLALYNRFDISIATSSIALSKHKKNESAYLGVNANASCSLT